MTSNRPPPSPTQPLRPGQTDRRLGRKWFRCTHRLASTTTTCGGLGRWRRGGWDPVVTPVAITWRGSTMTAGLLHKNKPHRLPKRRLPAVVNVHASMCGVSRHRLRVARPHTTRRRSSSRVAPLTLTTGSRRLVRWIHRSAGGPTSTSSTYSTRGRWRTWTSSTLPSKSNTRWIVDAVSASISARTAATRTAQCLNRHHRFLTNTHLSLARGLHNTWLVKRGLPRLELLVRFLLLLLPQPHSSTQPIPSPVEASIRGRAASQSSTLPLANSSGGSYWGL